MQNTLFDIAPLNSSDEAWFQVMLDKLQVNSEFAWPDRFGYALQKCFQEDYTPIRTLSLFSGGGGLDIGFHDAGFKVVEMVELETKYADTLKVNSEPHGYFDGASVKCIDIRKYEPRTNLNIDFIIGGPPCQTFSAAGRRAAGVRGTSDPRGTLFQEYVRLLATLQPRGFLFENVYGLIGAQEGDAWQEISQAFREAGYTIFHRILDAADYGVPQHRERLFIVGVRAGDFKFPNPTHGPDSIGQRPFYTSGAAISNVDLTETAKGIGGKFGQLLNDIPPGLNYSFI